jgi:Protein of unknown function (DUF2782)
MRKLLMLMLLAVAIDAAAQSTARARPPGTMPLEEAPPPPPMVETDPALEPQVTTRVEGDKTIQEYRVRGRLYMQKVTPRNGPSYILMDQRGDGTFSKQDNTLDNGNRVPQWVLLEF